MHRANAANPSALKTGGVLKELIVSTQASRYKARDFV
jgi:hypothetical protein